jgi:hypothetical protein
MSLSEERWTLNHAVACTLSTAYSLPGWARVRLLRFLLLRSHRGPSFLPSSLPRTPSLHFVTPPIPLLRHPIRCCSLS